MQTTGFGLNEYVEEMASLFNITPEEIHKPVKYPQIVQGRSLFCYWAVRELGMISTALAKKINKKYKDKRICLIKDLP